MADVAIRASATAAAPRDYTVPGAQEILPKTVAAVMDGSAAAVSWFPCLQVLDPGGNVMFSALSRSAIAAGASADVSWFPGGGLDLGGSAAAVTAIGARITNNLGQTINNDTWTNLVYEATVYDTDSMVNLGADNRKLTVNTGGLYMVVASTQWQNNNAGKRAVAVTHNDFMTNVAIPEASYVFDERMPVWDRLTGLVDDPQTTQTVVSFWQASAGDFFASGAFQLSGAGVGLGLHGYTYFAATLLGT